MNQSSGRDFFSRAGIVRDVGVPGCTVEIALSAEIQDGQAMYLMRQCAEKWPVSLTIRDSVTLVLSVHVNDELDAIEAKRTVEQWLLDEKRFRCAEEQFSFDADELVAKVIGRALGR